MKKYVVEIADIYETLQDLVAESSTLFDITINDVTVLTTDDLMNALYIDYYERSFVTQNATFAAGFIRIWNYFKSKHDNEFAAILAATLAEYDPLTTYAENRTITPNITNKTENTYGRTSTNSGGISTTYGKIDTNQLNTYDGSLRNSTKSTLSGTDSNTNTLKNTLGGTDKSETKTTGSNTITIDGYKENPTKQLESEISFRIRYDIKELIIKTFASEYLFYDNDNYKTGGLCL